VKQGRKGTKTYLGLGPSHSAIIRNRSKLLVLQFPNKADGTTRSRLQRGDCRFKHLHEIEGLPTPMVPLGCPYPLRSESRVCILGMDFRGIMAIIWRRRAKKAARDERAGGEMVWIWRLGFKRGHCR